jgi:hypothetical protein
VHGAQAWPVLNVGTALAPREGRLPLELGPEHASIETPMARLQLARQPPRLTVLARGRLPDAELVHPCLWPAAAVFARWRGLETLHGGAFVDARGEAWAVLGGRGAGKSSLLAALALHGHEVVADDLLVLVGGHCLAGPRCVDLRPEMVSELKLAALPWVRSSRRRRLALAPCQAQFPLRGCVYLEFGDDVTAEPMLPAEHLGRLTAQRRIAGLGANVGQLLDLSGLAAFRLRLSPAPGALEDAYTALLGAIRALRSYFSPTFGPSART